MTADYATNELWSQAVRSPFPRIAAKNAQPKTIGPIAGAPTLEVGFPMAYDDAEKKWVPWTASGTSNTNIIKGFVYPVDVDTSATKDVLGIIMLKGEIHYDDIIIPTGESEADLKEALRDGPLARGLIVRGLTEVR